MKHKLFLLLFLITAFQVQAQQHYKSIFGSQSTSWETRWANLFGESASTIYVQKDTLVNGFAYKKLVSNDNLLSPALIREDTITGKVWYRLVLPDLPPPVSNPMDTIEIPILNYSLSVGDTFDISGPGYFMPSPVPDSFNIVKRIY